MAKEKGMFESEDIISNDKVLKNAKRFYDGPRCNIETFYKKGTRISELKEEHKKLLGEKDL